MVAYLSSLALQSAENISTSCMDYLHNKTGLNINFVHNHIKSNGIIVMELSFNAKICHFGTVQLRIQINEDDKSTKKPVAEITEESSSSPSFTKPKESKLSGRANTKIEGVRGYTLPEFQSTSVVMQKSDVHAFGVVMLELLSGQEPLKYKFDRNTNEFTRTLVIETAKNTEDENASECFEPIQSCNQCFC